MGTLTLIVNEEPFEAVNKKLLQYLIKAGCLRFGKTFKVWKRQEKMTQKKNSGQGKLRELQFQPSKLLKL